MLDSEIWPMKIEVRINELLKERKRTYYWLSKKSGISHTTLWRLKKGKAHGINFATLEKICAVLDCVPGEVLDIARSERSNKNTPPNKSQR